MPDLITFGPVLLAAGTLLSLIMIAGRSSPLTRALCSAICIFCGARYVWWRYEYAMPVNQAAWQQLWAWIFFAFETLSVVSATGVLLFMSRHRSRSAEADRAAPPSLRDAPVDVFIATYNEPLAILERTIVGAKQIDHCDLRIWVLDDGARTWVRDLAEELGVHYVSRHKGAHAKAGNVNNGLKHALAGGRKPEFVLLLDADFIPYREILKRCLGLFREADVGIVQTPQHFFNPDPVQSNLFCARVWPDEQRFFFNTLLACKDAWGAAFCCGTSAVLRVEALMATGGLATETVTEDMLTTFKMEEHGYRTIYLNEMLSMGLAPESLKEYVSQRARWCLGAIQQIHTRWSFGGRAKLSLISRLSALDGVIYWMATAPFKLMMLSGPLLYWWTGTAVIASSMDDLIYWLAPAIVTSVIFMGHYANLRIIPIMTDVSQLLASFAVIRSVVTGLIKPWGHPFKVTAKNISTDKVTVQWNFLLPFAIMAAATALGIVRNVSQYSSLYGSDGYVVNVFWSIFNIFVLILACVICIELPKRRRHERFASGEAATLVLSSGARFPCVVRDISTSGANLGLKAGRIRSDDRGVIDFSHGEQVPFEVVREVTDGLAIRFDEDAASRRTLIAKLFTGGYENEVRQIKLHSVFLAVGKRLLA